MTEGNLVELADRYLGFLNIDKPLGLTSHDVIARLRRKLGIRRVGHAGTLDPLATGVLVVCVGPATRLSEYVMHATKRYTARIRLGVVTNTYDGEGEIVAENDASHITREDVERTLPRFVGTIEQVPPLYSALQQGGRRLYDIARAGKSVELEPRSVTIDSIAILDWSPPDVTLDVVCGPGTYIRSLAFDLGEALGVGAYLAGLTRTASGRFTLDQAVSLDTLLAADDPQRFIIPPAEALSDWRRVRLSDQDAANVRLGRVVSGAEGDDGTLALGLTAHDELVAILRKEEDHWQPVKVFSAGETV